MKSDKEKRKNTIFAERKELKKKGHAVVRSHYWILIFLMLIIKLMTAIGDRAERKNAPIPPPPKEAGPVLPLKLTGPFAPGSAGELKLYDTDPRTAAMLMAIVADELKTPLNELRFVSIKEVKENDP